MALAAAPGHRACRCPGAFGRSAAARPAQACSAARPAPPRRGRALAAAARMMVKEPKSGAEFPLAQRFWEGDEYRCIGAGMRAKQILMIKAQVYAVALYVEGGLAAKELGIRSRGGFFEGDADYCAALVDGAFNKALVFTMLRDLEGKQFSDAVNDKLGPRMQLTGDTASLEAFKGFIEGHKLAKGTQIMCLWTKAGDLEVVLLDAAEAAAAELERIAPKNKLHSEGFARALFELFLGDGSVVADAKPVWAAGAKQLLESEQIKLGGVLVESHEQQGASGSARPGPSPAAGSPVPGDSAAATDGSARPAAAATRRPSKARLLRSGNVFSLSPLNVFGVYCGFDNFYGSRLEVWAESECLLFCWPMKSLEHMATCCSPSMALDMMCWAVVSGGLHACAVARMLLDELPVRFATEDERQLARFLNRRSGMEPLEAREVIQRGHWVRVAAGERVLASHEIYQRVFLLVDGMVSMDNTGCCGDADASHHHSSAAGSPDASHHHHSRPLASTDSTGRTRPPAAAEQQPGGGGDSGAPGSLQALELPEASFSSPMSFTLVRAVSLEHALSKIKLGGVLVESHEQQGASGSARPGPSPAAGSPVPGDSAAATDGSARPAAAATRRPSKARLLRSGNVFSLSPLNVFGVYCGFDNFHGSRLEVWAESECLLFCWPMKSLEHMATCCSPSMAAYWRSFVLYTVASEFELKAHRGMKLSRCSTGEYEHAGWLMGGRSRDFTDPLRSYEVPERRSLARLCRWLRRAASPFQPRGMRHTALPLTGVMARTRAVISAEAKAQAARSRDVSLHSGGGTAAAAAREGIA
ncbi:FAP3 [Scenedesmus sp. PABB004]|nr:FAP3 [Scenedesmus sp. PABB004]